MALLHPPTALAAAALALFLARADPAAAAAKTDPVTPAAVQGLLDCDQAGADAARLACYDAAAARLRQALAAGHVVAVDRKQVTEVRRQAFGFTLPSLAMFSRADQAEPVDSVTAEIERAWRNPEGRWMVALKDGGLWRQIDAGDPSHSPKAGAEATVRRALMGSYMMTVGGPVAIRVHRDN